MTRVLYRFTQEKACAMSLINKMIRKASVDPTYRQQVLPLLKKIHSKVAAEAKAKPTKVVFVEAVLESPRALTAWLSVQKNAPSIVGWDVKSHHLTLEFFGNKGTAEDLKPYENLVGKEVTLNIVGFSYDESCVAVVIETDLPVASGIPHITVAVNGVPPSYSVDLLKERGTMVKAKGTLKAKIGYFEARSQSDKFELPHEFFTL